MCDEEAIQLGETVINQDTYKPGEEFSITLKVIFVVNDNPIFMIFVLDQSIGGCISKMCYSSC